MSRECLNPDCQAAFIPQKYASGHQKYCGREACRRYAARRRQAQYYRRRSVNPGWMSSHSERKKGERARRLATPAPVAEPPAAAVEPLAELRQATVLAQQTAILFSGMVTLIFGSSDHATVSEVIKQCMKNGSELLGAAADDRNSLLHELFLTPVRAGSPAVPDVSYPLRL